MKKYRFCFHGRQSSAIGITYYICDEYECKDINEAMSYVYQDYELFRDLQCWENGKEIEVPEKIEWVNARSHWERKRNEKGEYIKNY